MHLVDICINLSIRKYNCTDAQSLYVVYLPYDVIQST